MTDTEKNWDFDKWSENYDKTVQEENWIHGGYTEIIDKVVEMIAKYSKGKNIKLLDIGAGTGNLISKLQKHKNIEFWAIEPSKGMREKLIAKCGNIEIIDGMLPRLPEPEVKFDVIVSTYAIHHVNHSKTKLMVEKICKYANKNCMIIFADIMFENEKAFEDHIEELKAKNMNERIEDLEDEYFQYIDVLAKGFTGHGFTTSGKQYNFYIHIFRALR